MLLINFLKKASVKISVSLSRVYLMLFLFTISLHSQSPRHIADSIIEASKVKGIDSVLVTEIAKDFFKYCYSKPEVARYIADGAVELGKEMNSELLESRSYNLKGIFYDVTGKPDSALVLYNKSVKIAEKNKDYNGEASILNNIGLIYWNKEELQKAMNFYIKSLKIFESQNNINGQASNLNNIGLILTDLDREDEAISYFKQSLKNYKELNNAYGIGSNYTNISRVFFFLDRIDSSLYYNKLAMKTKKASGDYRGLGITYNHVGGDYFKENQLDSAAFYLKKADSIYTAINEKRLRLTNAKVLAKVYFDQGNYNASLKLNKLIYEALGESENDTKFDVTTQIADNYHKLGQYQTSNKYYVKALKLQDSIFEAKNKVATQEVFEKYQSAEKQKQILIQRAELAEQDLVIQKRNYQLYGLAFLTLILGLIGFLFYNQQKLKNQQLQKENELKDALIKIETQNKLQEQRLRISRDLHDNIGAQLTFIISSIDNLKYGFDIKDKKLTHKLETISDFTSGTIYELRDTIWAMNKSEITFEDLQTRISNYIDKAHLYDANIQFSFNVDSSVDTSKTFTSVEGMNIHRVIQEAIHNSLKYANASQIKVEISKVVSNLVFKISDNGKGFNVSTVRRGNGLANMEKRIANIGGEIQIISKENQGTQVIVTV